MSRQPRRTPPPTTSSLCGRSLFAPGTLALGLAACLVVLEDPAVAQEPPPPPEGVTAWSGYHASVRLTWFPALVASGATLPQGSAASASIVRGSLQEPGGETWLSIAAPEDPARDGPTYVVERAESAEGPFATVASGVAHSWYRDGAVENGRPYFYRVRTVSGGVESVPSEVVRGRPRSEGYLIRAGFADEPPVLDGRILPGEWSRATTVNITSPGSSGLAVTAWAMNSVTHLYVAVRDPNFPFPDDFNQIGIYFDENHDGAWNAPPERPEGNVWILYDATFDETWNWFRALTGEWPFGVGAVQFGEVGSVVQRMSFASGDAEFEVAIDLSRVPLVASPGSTVGFGLYSDQTGTAPFTGDWPAGIFASPLYFKAPVLYGDLVLAAGAPVAVREEGPDGDLTALPNPARGAVTIRTSAAATMAAGLSRLLVYDISGRLVARIPWEGREASWDGKDGAGRSVPPGVYLFRLDRKRGAGSGGAAEGRVLILR